MSDSHSAGNAKFLEGWALHQQGNAGRAWALYQEAIALDPRHFDALHLAGIIAAQARFFDQAADLIGRALAVDPNSAAAHYNLGNTLADVGRADEAITHYDRAIALDPANPEPYNNRGNTLWKQKRFDAAIASFDAAIAAKPDFAAPYNNRGNVLRDLGRAGEALASFDKGIALDSTFADLHTNRGNALSDLRRYVEAVAAYDRAIALKPNSAEAFSNRGNALRELGRNEEAIASYDVAVRLRPDYAEAFFNRGTALRLLKRFDAARASHNEAIRLNPTGADAFNARGLVHADMKQYEAALADYDRAIALGTPLADVYNNRGVVLGDLKRYEAALESYAAAIARRPDYAEAYNNRAIALKELGRTDAALESYAKAIALKPGVAEPYFNRAILLNDAQRHTEAIESYAQALALKPDYPFLRGALLHTRMHVCQWDDFNTELAALLPKVAAGEKVTGPFQLLSLVDSPALHHAAAATWTKFECAPNTALGPVPRQPRSGKIRIGYFSMDFRNHPVSMLAAGMIEAHDRGRFETFAFSYGADTGDHLRKRMEAAFDTFYDVRAASNEDVARQARDLGIDIAIDLAGYTNDSRTAQIFSLGAAPVQVNYLGYPGTMGADFYDYIIVDPVIAPREHQAHFSEKLVHMPLCYQANDRLRPVSDRVFNRAQLGLPERGFVFCSFNNTFKITPAIFDAWMRILSAVPGSVLWLLEDNATAGANLRREAARRGVDPGRLIFAARAPQGDHLARQRAADLFLDTLPYNAHTTASDALWVGLPLLTCRGESFPARVAASILSALGLPELITDSLAAYEAKAIALARDPAALGALRQKLTQNRDTSPLFIAQAFARAIDGFYLLMHERSQAGLPPDHLFHRAGQTL